MSGHPNRDDLKDMYKWVKPKCIIPVHGEHRHMIEHINFAKEMQIPQTLLVQNGDIIKIFPGNEPQIIDKAPSGRMYLDGSIGVYEDSQSVKDRKFIYKWLLRSNNNCSKQWKNKKTSNILQRNSRKSD